MFKNLIKHRMGNEEGKYEKGKSYFVTKGDGIYQTIQHHAFSITRLKSKFEDGFTIPYLEHGSGQEVEVKYELDEKVPFKFIIHMTNFYKRVHELVRTEASLHLFHLNTMSYEELFDDIGKSELSHELSAFKRNIVKYGDFFAYAPKQRNSGALTQFNQDKLFDYLADHPTLITVMETHSHHTMGAFWSGTDLANQNDFYYYLVLGQIHRSDTMLLKYVVDGKVTNFPLHEIINVPQVTINNIDAETASLLGLSVEPEYYSGVIPYNKDEFNQEWLANIQSHDLVLLNERDRATGENDKYVNFNQGQDLEEVDELETDSNIFVEEKVEPVKVVMNETNIEQVHSDISEAYCGGCGNCETCDYTSSDEELEDDDYDILDDDEDLYYEEDYEEDYEDDYEDDYIDNYVADFLDEEDEEEFFVEEEDYDEDEELIYEESYEDSNSGYMNLDDAYKVLNRFGENDPFKFIYIEYDENGHSKDLTGKVTQVINNHNEQPKIVVKDMEDDNSTHIELSSIHYYECLTENDIEKQRTNDDVECDQDTYDRNLEFISISGVSIDVDNSLSLYENVSKFISIIFPIQIDGFNSLYHVKSIQYSHTSEDNNGNKIIPILIENDDTGHMYTNKLLVTSENIKFL